MNWNKVMIVGLGGFIGAALRYVISLGTSRYFGSFPIGTLLVNVVGGLLMGFIMEASRGLWTIPGNLRMFLTTGIMGGLTTFSTFSYETLSYVSDGRYLMGGFNAALNLFFALLACWGGMMIAQAV